jgi:DinB superfamily
MMDRPERVVALEYLRRKGTDAPVSKLLSGLRSTFQRLEQGLDRLPEALRAQRPAAASWSVHEIVDHLVESHRPAVAELRALCAGVSPRGGPIPARLTSSNALERPWGSLIDELKRLHAEVLDLVASTGDLTFVAARAPFVMVVKVSGATGSDVLEWVEALDWKAYAQALRVHTHEHLAQVERTVSALRSYERNCEAEGV